MAEILHQVATPEEMQQAIENAVSQLREEFSGSLAELNQIIADRIGEIHPHVFSKGDAPWQETISSLREAITSRLDSLDKQVEKITRPPAPAPARMTPPALPEPPPPPPVKEPDLDDVGGLPAAVEKTGQEANQEARKIMRI